MSGTARTPGAPCTRARRGAGRDLRRALPVSAGGSVKTPSAAVQLPLPGMGGIAGFYEARTDRVLCVRCAGTPTPAGTPIPEPDCGDLQPLPATAAGRQSPRQARRGAGVVRVAQQRWAGVRGAVSDALALQAAQGPARAPSRGAFRSQQQFHAALLPRAGAVTSTWPSAVCRIPCLFLCLANVERTSRRFTNLVSMNAAYSMNNTNSQHKSYCHCTLLPGPGLSFSTPFTRVRNSFAGI